MNPSPEPAGEQPAPKPGKIRTWWHPLLANLLRWQLGNYYRLEEEVLVGKVPLQIDLLLVQKEQGELPAHAREMLAGLVERLGEFTLIEFKSPSDTLGSGDFHTILAYALLYRAQNNPLLEPRRLHLVVIAPRLTKPYREEMKILGVTAEAEGVWRVQGGILEHPMWVLETEVLAGLQHPLLTVVSPRLLAHGLEIYETLSQAGYTDLIVYMAQQIGRFRSFGKEFAMQHLGAEKELRKALRELTDVFKALPLEDRLNFVSVEEVLKGLPAEERLKGLPAQERLKGLSVEDMLQGLAPEVLERLRKLLQPKAGD